MRRIWRQRAVRQLALGLVPLLIVGAGLIAGLTVVGVHTAGKLSAAGARADGLVRRIDSHGGHRSATIDWTDRAGRTHRSHLDFPADSHPRPGATVHLRYVPGHPDRVYAQGDSTVHRLDALLAGILYATLVLIAATATTAVRAARRLAANRRPAATVRLSRVRTRFGLIQRSWLVASQGRVERWVPVFWEPVLPTLLADTPCLVHGDLAARGAIVVEIGDAMLWSSGRVRGAAPRGRQFPNAGSYPAKAGRLPAPAAPIPLGRQAIGDASLVVIAPVLGILWAYINGAGAVGFGLATVLLAGVLFWVPGSYGSDPT